MAIPTVRLISIFGGFNPPHSVSGQTDEIMLPLPTMVKVRDYTVVSGFLWINGLKQKIKRN
jgi:hypothetical protein